MQMTVRPAHCDLNDVVQTIQGHVASHDDAPPDGWFRPFERDFELIEWNATAGLGFGNQIHGRNCMRRAIAAQSDGEFD